MSARPFPEKSALTIAFAHGAYRFGPRFAARGTGIAYFEVPSDDALQRRIADADVLVISGLWRNELLDRAPKLRYVQSISAGVNQYSVEAFRAHGVRLASAQGVNVAAVAHHATALMLALARQLHISRDNQAGTIGAAWRPTPPPARTRSPARPC